MSALGCRPNPPQSLVWRAASCLIYLERKLVSDQSLWRVCFPILGSGSCPDRPDPVILRLATRPNPGHTFPDHTHAYVDDPFTHRYYLRTEVRCLIDILKKRKQL